MNCVRVLLADELPKQTVSRLVIVDIGPDIAPRGTERGRQLAGNAPETFHAPEEALAYLKSMAVGPVNEAAMRHRVAHGLTRLSNGTYTWKYDAFLRQQRRQGTMPAVDLWPDVRQIQVPTLIVRGAESDIFAPETMQRMQASMPDCQVVDIPGAGHTVPTDAPEAFEKAVRDFLAA